MPELSTGIIGELILEEIDEWHSGVCTITHKDDKIKVYGENEHFVGEVDLSQYKIRGDVDLVLVKSKVEELVRTEMNEL